MTKKKLKVLFASAECAPFAKVGGLGDVAGSLPAALRKLGVDIAVVIPKYDIVPSSFLCKKIIQGMRVKKEKVNVWQGFLPGTDVSVYFLENKKFFSQGEVYLGQSPKNSFMKIARFLFFSEAVLELASLSGAKIIHCNDWHTAMIPVLTFLRSVKVKTLLTIHNLSSQGEWRPKEVLDFLGLKISQHPHLSLRTKHTKRFNILQQGILAADLINTVSPTYREEILTAKLGAGLDQDLQQRENNLSGILNGLDLETFNPQKNKDIVQNYSFKDIRKKAINKKELQKECGLPVNEKFPLLGLVGRLTSQKGIDIIARALPRLAKLNCQLVLLGTGGGREESLLEKLVQKYPQNLSLHFKFDTALGQRVYAGADIFLMPSLFEPCGLGQLIAQRYGTIPVVRKTGGLADTIIDGKTGFLFQNYSATDFMQTMRRALEAYYNEKQWQKIIKQAMSKDFSWQNSARKYLKLYQKL